MLCNQGAMVGAWCKEAVLLWHLQIKTLQQVLKSIITISDICVVIQCLQRFVTKL